MFYKRKVETQNVAIFLIQLQKKVDKEM